MANLSSVTSPSISLRDLVTADSRYRIPCYQRGYAWTLEQVGSLWHDLLSSDADRGHYLGTIVLHKASVIECADIIDGQQRLTTLIILLNVLGGCKFSLKDTISMGVPEEQTFLSDLLRTKSGLMESSMDTTSRKNLCAASAFFESKIVETTPEILAKIWNSKLMVFTTNDLKDATRIFHSLNTGGVRLTKMDILKNLLFQEALQIDDADKKIVLHELEATFQKVNKELTIKLIPNLKIQDLQADEFLDAHWILFCSKIAKDADPLVEIGKALASCSDRCTWIRSYLGSLRDLVTTYRQVCAPYEVTGLNGDLHEALKRFHRLGAGYRMEPLLMVCTLAAQATGDSKGWSRAINFLENLAFRRALAKINSEKSGLKTIACNMARAIREGNAATLSPPKLAIDVFTALQFCWWNQEECSWYGFEWEENIPGAEDHFKSNDFYSHLHHLYHYMMLEFEKHLAIKNNQAEYNPNEGHWLRSESIPKIKIGQAIPFRDHDIEHIRPQRDLKANPSLKYLDRLGNLTLATEHFNRGVLGSKSYNKKSEDYEKGNTLLLKHILQIAGTPAPDEWTLKHCEQLEEDFLKFARARWGNEGLDFRDEIRQHLLALKTKSQKKAA